MTVYGAGRHEWLLDHIARVILSWDEGPGPAGHRLDSALRTVTPHELIHLESAYRNRRYSLGALGRDALAGDRTPGDGPQTDRAQTDGTQAHGTQTNRAQMGGTQVHGTQTDRTQAHGTQTDRTRADGIRADGTDGRGGMALAALMSFDRSGHLREAGVARLTGTEDPFAVPFLLLRLNDPVEQVRLLSQDAVAARLGPDHVGLLVQLLPLIDGLRRP
ncbi:hypothetical protein ACFVFH_01060 [Streptomyces sp. NPDC057697]|uniref:hypothetical protein n=1 Tax=Streptomyces sp. NPDC057697 TaxID=3346219 RepID=UPI00369794CE